MCTNLIKDNEVPSKNVELEENDFSRGAGRLKIKNIHSRSELARDSSIDIQKEVLSVNEDVILSIDELKLNSLKFLMSAFHSMHY